MENNKEKSMNHHPTGELLQKIANLEESLRTKTHLISLIAHDRKEFLGIAISLIEAWEDKNISDSELFALLPEIKQSAQKNLQTIHELSAWIKTQYGGFKPSQENIILHDIFKTLGKEHGQVLRDKQVQFLFVGDERHAVTTDSVLLSYILSKFVHNAIKYSPSNSIVEFYVEPEADETVISVVDYGSPIPETTLEKLFTFETPKHYGTSGEIGTGLSLIIAQELAQLINAKLTVSSTPSRTKAGIRVKRTEQKDDQKDFDRRRPRYCEDGNRANY